MHSCKAITDHQRGNNTGDLVALKMQVKVRYPLACQDALLSASLSISNVIDSGKTMECNLPYVIYVKVTDFQ